MDIWTYMVSWADRIMAPPPLRQFASTSALSSRHVTEDTPPDLLEGTMDLTVILPTGHRVNMAVHRSTPMMDLLIQVTTAHKVNPGGHIIHVVSDNRLVSYKPSTPIGTLDTNVIQIVPKNKVNEEAKKRRAHLVTQAIEKNIRLKVNLPRNQLAVYRVPPKTLISDVLTMVCKDRCLDVENHEIRHPVNVDEKLRGSCTLADYQLQEICVVPRDFRAPPLSVTDLITMAAISHSEDKKRRGILSLFSRKTKSSTGDSSLSSGSAGERSVSPARSDESADGRPTPRPLSPASSSATLTSSHPQPPLSRPTSTVNIARTRKRQAPAPPPAPPPAQAHHTNGKAEPERRDAGGNLSRRSSDSSGYHESEHRSPYTSPAGSEISSVDTHRGANNLAAGASTNLTSVTSTSSLSLASSRGKRRAPPPPKPPPVRGEEARPSAIPEESESPSAPSKPRVNGEADHAPSSPTASTPQPPETHPSSPTSSHVSSVSSLSSVEHQQAASGSAAAAAAATASSSSSSPLLPPPPDVECPPPPPPPASASDRTNSGASPSLASSPPYPRPEAADSGMTQPHRSHSASTSSSSSSSSSSSDTHSPTIARATVAARDGPEMQHEAAAAASGLSSSTINSSGASGVLSPDRLEGQPVHRPPSADTRKRHVLKEDARTEGTPPNKSARQHGGGGDGAPSAILDPEDAIVPQGANMENMSGIPMFRIVKKSQTTVKQDDDVGRKFIIDGKTQQFGEEEKFGTRGKASGKGNPLARGGKLNRQEDLLFDDDDLDINEDMFAPKDGIGNSMTENMEWNYFNEGQSFESPGASQPAASSTPVNTATPPVLPRKISPAPEPTNKPVIKQNSSLELSFENSPPKPKPRYIVPKKKRAPPPPVAKPGVTEVTQPQQLVASVPQDLSVRPKYSELPPKVQTSPQIPTEAEAIERVVSQPPDEEFKVHVSKLANVDPDMLSLLSEEDVDTISQASHMRSRTSSVSSREEKPSRMLVDAGIIPVELDTAPKSRSSSSGESSHSSPPPSPVAPSAAVAAPSTASSYRAGYLAMIAQLSSWDNSESLETAGLESSDSRSSTPRGSLQETPAPDSSPRTPSSEDPPPQPSSSSEGAHTGPSTRPRLVSSSSLCSDTDHEVQTRTASFSSETSEDNVVSSVVESVNTPSEESLKPEPEEKNIDVPTEKPVEEVVQTTVEEKTKAESISSRSSFSSLDEDSQTHVESLPMEAKDIVEAVSPIVNDASEGPRDSCSSQSVTDSEGDSREDDTKAVVAEDKVKEEVIITEVLETPIITMKIPEELKAVPNGSVDSSSDISNGKHIPVTNGSRKNSVSSMSSTTSADSAIEAEQAKLTAQVAQENSRKVIESHLEAAFADLDVGDPSTQVAEMEADIPVPPLVSPVTKEAQVDTWEYKIPDPPTPFKDGPSSRATDESSSVSSEAVPEVLSDVPSGFKDSPSNSVSVVETIDAKVLRPPVDTTDSASTASSRRSSTSSVSTEKSKQSVINELKTTLKEANNNEPRIIELKPKAKSPEAKLPVHKEVPPVETQAEVLPVRANFPVQHPFVPRVLAKVSPSNTEPRLVLEQNLFSKTRMESVSSYESCNTPEPRERSDSDSSSARDRSSSNTSYESAPPPLPDAPLPSESEVETRISRSSSDVSDRTRQQDYESSDDQSLTFAPVMKFSISTYKSRAAEESSYDKKLTKSESFSHQTRPKAEGSKLLKAESLAALIRTDEGEKPIETIPEVKEEPAVEKPAVPSVPSPEKPVIVEATLKPSQLFAKPVPPTKPASLTGGSHLGRINSFNDRPGIYRTNSIEGRFGNSDQFRAPRRLQRSDSQEQLGRANSLHNLATPNYDLRKAQSSYEISSGSNGNNGNSGMPGMPGMMGMPPFMGGGMMPHDARLADEFMKLQQDFFKWQQQLLQNQHVLHSRVAPLASNPPQLQSVGVLRDIMAQTPPSDGGNGNAGMAEAYNPVMETQAAPAGPRERIITIRMEGADGESDDSKPMSRTVHSQVVHNITNDMSRLNTSGQPKVNTVHSRRWVEEPNVSVGSWVERPSQPVGVFQDQDYATSAPRSHAPQDFQPSVEEQQQPSSMGPSLRTMSQGQRPSHFAQQQQQPQFNQPQQSQFSQPQQSQFSQPQQSQFSQPQPSQFSQPQQLHNLSPQQQQQFAQFLQQQQQQRQPPQFMQQQQQQQQQQPRQPVQFMQPVQSKTMPQKQPSPSFVQAQPKQPSPPLAQQQKQPSPAPMQTHQPKQPSPPAMQSQQQRHASPQYLQQPKQPSPPAVQSQQGELPQQERAAFWRELEARRQDFGLQNEPNSPEPTRPPRRNSRQNSPTQDNADTSKPLTYFGQQAVVNEPPQTYYYNGEGAPAMSKVNNGASLQRPREESETGPRYTSVVTVSSDKGEASNGAAPAKDKVRSVVQLNNDQRGQPRPAPVVRGFRQPGDDQNNQGNTFHSRILSGGLKGQQPGQSRSSVSPPTTSSVPAPLLEPVPQAPTAARLVAALSQTAPKAPSPSPMAPVAASRVSPPRVSPPRVSPPRSSPSRTSPSAVPAFQNVQLRPVPGGSRGSTPPEAMSIPPPPAPVPPPAPPAPQMGSMPPPPPPAPPMAPPPPPAPMAADGERRTATGKRIVAPKTAPSLDPREELMMAIRNHGGFRNLRRTHNMVNE